MEVLTIVVSDKMAVVGRRPRSDEYSPAVAAVHANAAAAAAAAALCAPGVGTDAAEMRVNHHARPLPLHYSDYVQVGSTLLPLSLYCSDALLYGKGLAGIQLVRIIWPSAFFRY